MADYTPGRYEGFGSWYDDVMNDQGKRGKLNDAAHALLAGLIGSGSGVAVDVGCGTGIMSKVLKELGYTPLGFDFAYDQLRIAKNRLPVAQADATRLPIRSASVSLAYSTFITTDWDNLEEAVAEIYRILKSGGRYIDLGTHPCFYGGFSVQQSDGTVVQYPGYRGSKYLEPSHYNSEIRRRVGGWHRPISEIINIYLRAGFVLEKIIEGGPDAVPSILGVIAVKR
ncbi:class I SAM-dependent methyltransferase [Treponema primitia]|uniref:class I SAM-dependent methyltransferase n=1 Tax=Treponema primitia TaxID=88058 RepID=UPI00398068F7